MNLTELKGAKIIRGDYAYKEAVHYYGTYYNPPCTLNYKGKKYILACGSDDKISVYKQGEYLIIVSQHHGLNYVSYSALEIETGHEVNSFYIESNDMEADKSSIFYGLNKKSHRKIAKYLQNL